MFLDSTKHNNKWIHCIRYVVEIVPPNIYRIILFDNSYR